MMEESVSHQAELEEQQSCNHPLEIGEEILVLVEERPVMLKIDSLLDEGGFSYVYKCLLRQKNGESEGKENKESKIVIMKVYKGGVGRSVHIISNEYFILKHLMNNKTAAGFVASIIGISSFFPNKIMNGGGSLISSKAKSAAVIPQFNALIFPFYALNLHDVLSGQFKFIANEMGSEEPKKCSYLPIPIKKIILKNLITAIAAIHAAGVLHLDLKLENIFLEFEEDPPIYNNIKFPTKIRIIDFNSSAMINNNDELRRYCGTTAYLAPEIILSMPLGRYTDLWALGVLIYEIISEGYLFESHRFLSEDPMKKSSGYGDDIFSTSSKSRSRRFSAFKFRTSNCAEYPENYSLLRDFYMLLGPPPQTDFYENFIGYYYNSKGEPLLHQGEMSKVDKDLSSKLAKECSNFGRLEEFFIKVRSLNSKNMINFNEELDEIYKKNIDELGGKRKEFFDTAADIILSFLSYNSNTRRSIKFVLKKYEKFFE
jgi:serine/threonine protein kinase